MNAADFFHNLPCPDCGAPLRGHYRCNGTGGHVNVDDGTARVSEFREILSKFE